MASRTTQAPAPPSVVFQSGNRALSNHVRCPHCVIATVDSDLHEIVNGAVTQLRCTAAFVQSGNDAMTSTRTRRTSLVFVD